MGFNSGFKGLNALAKSSTIYACRSKISLYSNRMRRLRDKGKQEITRTRHTWAIARKSHDIRHMT